MASNNKPIAPLVSKDPNYPNEFRTHIENAQNLHFKE